MNYATILDGLRAERAKLDKLIAIMETLNGDAPAPSSRRPKGGEQRRPPSKGRVKAGKGRGPDPALMPRAQKLRAEGLTAAAIAKELGIKESAINRWASEQGWPKRGAS